MGLGTNFLGWWQRRKFEQLSGHNDRGEDG